MRKNNTTEAHNRQRMLEYGIVSSSSGKNQAQESSGRSLVQALSRTAVPVSLPQVRPAGACLFFIPELFYTNQHKVTDRIGIIRNGFLCM